MSIEAKFHKLGTDNAPGQEVRQAGSEAESRFHGPKLDGTPVDFSHGDVDAHTPTPGAFDLFQQGVAIGGAQAYTEYRGDQQIRALLAPRLEEFTGAPVDAHDGLMLTPGDGGAAGVESRWHMAPRHAPGVEAWALSRRRARTAPVKDWTATRAKGGRLKLTSP